MFQILLNNWWQYLVVAVVCFGFGSINYSVIFSRLLKKDDVRQHGSGNAGTTNMFRVFGLKMGLLTFLCDTVKGVVPCLLARLIFANAADGGVFASYVAGLFAVTGHIFPLFLRFRGGKGFATTLGFMLAVQPILALCVILALVAVILLTDRMSVAALFAVLVFTACHWIFLLPTVGIECCILISIDALLVIIAHRANIVRLFQGCELPTGVRKALSKSQ
jgi:glycerol-3-phosphate acyltransferase PlsY